MSTKIHAPLKTYAVEPKNDMPPDLLPFDDADAWWLDGAARQALGLLAGGEEPGDRLFAMADYLLTFCMADLMTFCRRRGDMKDALLLNGTALALCGYVCDGRHQEAELWRLSGAARLATEAHKRKAALNDRMLSDCITSVCRMADEKGLPILADLISLRERMWGRLLDHGRAERLHVPEEAFPSFMINPVPVDQVGALMRNRRWQERARFPEYCQAPDMENAEQACGNLLTLRAHMFVRHQFGSDIDWHLRLFNDLESTVSLAGLWDILNLARAHVKTGKKKYAENAVRLLWSFYKGLPIPNHQQPDGPWRTLETGVRQCLQLPDIIGYLGGTDAFDEPTHAMIARSRLEHMRYAMAFCGWPNNWYQAESSGLAVAAMCSPEVRLSDSYLRIALRRLKWINSLAYYNDGFQFELTHGYHRFPTTCIMSVLNVARARGVELPDDFAGLVERAHEMYLYAALPDRSMPTFNDCNAIPDDPKPLLRMAGEIFDRSDLLWGGTSGKMGRKPDHASHAWSDCGLYAMRSSWKEDAQYLHFDGAPWGASHQHEDKLNFVLYANGRLLINDPNIYSYSMTELTHYFRSSRAHNVVMIDGRGQARRFRTDAMLSTEGRNEWVSADAFDFVSSEYLEGFAPDPYPQCGKADEVDAGVTHRRAIFYVKNEYWILCDLIGGEGEHTLEQLFHIAPVATGDPSEPFRAGEVAVSPEEIVTRDAGVGNLAILPVDPDGLAVRKQKGETSPAVGWHGVFGEFPAWDVTVETRAALPARLDAVLFPTASGKTEHPETKRLVSDAQTTAFRVAGPHLDDTFILCEAGSGEVTVGDIVFEGRALLVRRLPELRAFVVNGKAPAVDGKTIPAGQIASIELSEEKRTG